MTTYDTLIDADLLQPISRSPRRGILGHPLRLTILADLVGAVLAVALVDLVGADPSDRAAGVIVILWLASMVSARSYEPMPTGFSEMRWRRVLRATVGLGLACWLISAVRPGLASPAELLLMTAALTGAALCHRGLTRVLRVALRAPGHPTPVVVAGDPDDVSRMLGELQRGRTRLWDVVTVCLTRPPQDGADRFGRTVRVGVDELLPAALESQAEAAIIVPCRELDPTTLRRMSWQLEHTGIQLYLGTGLLDVGPSRATMVRGGDLGMVHVRSIPRSGPAQTVKTFLERFAAGLALLLLSPLLLAIAIGVRWGSPGGAIFRQTRVGVRGREFTMYKFRSMSDGADAKVDDLAAQNDSDAVLFKIKNDPRITPIGAFLRRYSLDELPQLFNVLRGDMALVGPRPALPVEVAQYDADAVRRLAVRPGLTGLWQVSGRSDLTWEDTVRLDLHYVDNWTFLLDLGIVLRTVGTVLGHRGAY